MPHGCSYRQLVVTVVTEGHIRARVTHSLAEFTGSNIRVGYCVRLFSTPGSWVWPCIVPWPGSLSGRSPDREHGRRTRQHAPPPTTGAECTGIMTGGPVVRPQREMCTTMSIVQVAQCAKPSEPIYARAEKMHRLPAVLLHCSASTCRKRQCKYNRANWGCLTSWRLQSDCHMLRGCYGGWALNHQFQAACWTARGLGRLPGESRLAGTDRPGSGKRDVSALLHGRQLLPSQIGNS